MNGEGLQRKISVTETVGKSKEVKGNKKSGLARLRGKIRKALSK